MVIDSYEEFQKWLGIRAFYRFGLEHTIFIAPEAAKVQAAELWTRWDNKEKLSIRKSKREAKFKDFYNRQEVNIAVEKDNQPFRKLLERGMGYKDDELRNFQCTHIIGANSNPILMSSVWNMAFSPNVVAAMTDEKNMSTGDLAADYYALLKGVVWKLYRGIIADYESRVAAVLQNIEPSVYATTGVTEDEAKKEWSVPDKEDVFAEYEEICGKMGMNPEFTCRPVEFFDQPERETNAIRIVFHSEQ